MLGFHSVGCAEDIGSNMQTRDHSVNVSLSSWLTTSWIQLKRRQEEARTRDDQMQRRFWMSISSLIRSPLIYSWLVSLWPRDARRERQTTGFKADALFATSLQPQHAGSVRETIRLERHSSGSSTRLVNVAWASTSWLVILTCMLIQLKWSQISSRVCFGVIRHSKVELIVDDGAPISSHSVFWSKSEIQKLGTKS